MKTLFKIWLVIVIGLILFFGLTPLEKGVVAQSSIVVFEDNFDDGVIDNSLWIHNGWTGGVLQESNGTLYFESGTCNDQQVRSSVNFATYDEFTITFDIKPDWVSGDKNVGFWLGNLVEGMLGETEHNGYVWQFHGKTQGFNIVYVHPGGAQDLLHDTYDPPKWTPGQWISIKIERTLSSVKFYFNGELVGVDDIHASDLTDLYWITKRPWKDDQCNEGARIHIDNFQVIPSTTCTICSNHCDSFAWNGFSVLNNQWGREYAEPGWYQRIIKEDNGTVSFEYKWQGNSSKVKGYPAVIAGWHFAESSCNYIPSGDFGLPAMISENKAFNSGIKALHVKKGSETMNLSWDIWIVKSIPPDKPSDEIMIWPWRKNQKPIGEIIEKKITLWNTKWDLYYGKNSITDPPWNVFTFVRRSNTLDTSGDLGDFINYLKEMEALKNDQYIVGIECGTEIIKGQGSWNIISYSLTP